MKATTEHIAIFADGEAKSHTAIQALSSAKRVPRVNRAQSNGHLAIALHIIAKRIPLAGPEENKSLGDATDLLARAIERNDFVSLTTSLDLHQYLGR